MHTYVAGQRAHTPEDIAELALGTPLELWLGLEGESEEERAARTDAARDILAEDPELPDRAVRAAVRALEEAGAFKLTALPQPRRRVRTARRRSVLSGVAG